MSLLKTFFSSISMGNVGETYRRNSEFTLFYVNHIAYFGHCDQPVCLTEHKIPQIKVPHGFVSENVNLVVKVICDSCSEQ
tara:strand:+ start:2000 stop:2239 length:240 start_codon:yes stop_codon:yes gene_type:complete